MKTHKIIDSPIGPLTLVAADGALCGLYLEGHIRRPDRAAFGDPAGTDFEAAEEQLEQYFAGQRTEFTVPTLIAGTDFQRRVWGLLVQIPYGQTRTYAQLAETIGDRALSRAIGAANGRNPISIIVPCHRLIGSDGSLTGYAGGLERKRYLLELEAAGAARTAPYGRVPRARIVSRRSGR